MREHTCIKKFYTDQFGNRLIYSLTKVEAHFRCIQPPARKIRFKADGRSGFKIKRLEVGKFCQNCGIIFSKRHTDKEIFRFKEYYVCYSCRELLESELKTNICRATPTLNDLENTALKTVPLCIIVGCEESSENERLCEAHYIQKLKLMIAKNEQ